ncbi:hypothetical protein HMPREF9960_0534 [Streptococcus cristatus ATCC 51100]|uniref:Uncharacterized protein n=1 Tax=Streptococcus cristatus ATCC 51100 TaxID=889201 RepID=A0AAV3ED15_STRCR|nr:hypothetical protein HMPREF9960_0534 [Streptococcus cristatus ATCC 51100]
MLSVLRLASTKKQDKIQKIGESPYLRQVLQSFLEVFC